MKTLNLQSLPLFFLISLIVLTSVSCNKSDDTSSQTETKTKTTLLTQSNWKLVKSEEKAAAAVTWNDVTSTISACKKDDIYVFTTAGTWELNEGATKCSAGNPQVFLSGTWVFFNAETQLKRYEGVGTSLLVTYNIELLDESSLIITTTGGSIYTRETYGH